MKVLNVVQHEGEWVITGLTGGVELPLYFHIPYPETEWPEIGEIKGHKEMLKTLYDEWQTSEELERENKLNGGDGLYFHTPFGDYATYSFHVGPAPEICAVANKVEKRLSAVRNKIELMLRAGAGWTEEDSDRVHAKYGSKFADWPEPERQRYWAAMNSAHEAVREIFS